MPRTPHEMEWNRSQAMDRGVILNEMKVDIVNDFKLGHRHRIDIVINSLEGGGAERVMVALANEFAEQGDFVRLIALCREGPYISEISDTVVFCCIHAKRARAAVRSLANLFRKDTPYVILSSQWHVNIATIVARTMSGINPRLVIREGTTLGIYKTGSIARIQDILKRLPYRMADAIIAPSVGAAESLANFAAVPRSLIYAIPNPVDVDHLQSKSKEVCGAIRHVRRKYIAALGRLSPEKGFDVLLRAFAGIVGRVDVDLIVTGDGQSKIELVELSRALGIYDRVHFTGYIENPFPILARSELFVLASRREGMPNALLQALALNIPVIATDCPSGPREILETLSCGRLVPVDDVGALCDAMLLSLSECFSTKTSDLIQMHFGSSQIAMRFRSIMLDLQ